MPCRVRLWFIIFECRSITRSFFGDDNGCNDHRDEASQNGAPIANPNQPPAKPPCRMPARCRSASSSAPLCTIWRRPRWQPWRCGPDLMGTAAAITMAEGGGYGAGVVFHGVTYGGYWNSGTCHLYSCQARTGDMQDEACRCSGMTPNLANWVPI